MTGECNPGFPVPSGRGPHASRWGLPGWAWAYGLCWLIFIGAWEPALLVAAPQGFNRPLTAYALVAVGALAVLSSVGWGAVLALLRGWRWLGPSLLAGTWVLLAWYLVAVFTVNDPSSDNLAAVGLVIISVPTLLLVAVLLSVGFGIGAAYRRIFRHHR
jgi:hypothetical protein